MTTILASSMAFIDGTVVNVTLPALQNEFGATVEDVQWVIESYALSLTALLLVGGKAGDQFGRRRIFAMGVAIFSVASIWCGIASSIGQLILARAVQGIGGALLVPGSLALISASFAEDVRGKAIGTWSGYTAITTALGPVIGGFLIQHFSWRYAFFINVPIALVVLLLTFKHVPESRSGNPRDRLDWVGAILVSTGLGSLVYALIASSSLGWQNSRVLLSLTGALFTLGFFLYVETRHPAPMLPLHLFRSRNFSGANILTLLLYAALGGAMFFLPLNLIQVQGYSTTAAGAALLPLILSMFLLSRWSGTLVDRYGAKRPLIFGPCIAASGFALFSLPGIGGSYWTNFFPPILLLGLGMAVSVAPLTTTVMNALDTHLAGIASGINNAVSRAAALLAIALLGIVMNHAFGHALHQNMRAANSPPSIMRSVMLQKNRLAAIELPVNAIQTDKDAVKQAVNNAFVHGFRRVMLVCALLAAASAIGALLMIEGPQHMRHEPNEKRHRRSKSI